MAIELQVTSVTTWMGNASGATTTSTVWLECHRSVSLRYGGFLHLAILICRTSFRKYRIRSFPYFTCRLRSPAPPCRPATAPTLDFCSVSRLSRVREVRKARTDRIDRPGSQGRRRPDSPDLNTAVISWTRPRSHYRWPEVASFCFLPRRYRRKSADAGSIRGSSSLWLPLVRRQKACGALLTPVRIRRRNLGEVHPTVPSPRTHSARLPRPLSAIHSRTHPRPECNRRAFWSHLDDRLEALPLWSLSPEPSSKPRSSMPAPDDHSLASLAFAVANCCSRCNSASESTLKGALPI